MSDRTKIIIRVLITLGILGAAFFRYYPWKGNNPPQKNKTDYFLSGTVVDASSNENVSQAEITVVGRNDQYVTETNGNFRIPFRDSIPHVRIRVKKMGFLTVDKSYDIPSLDIIIQLNHNK